MFWVSRIEFCKTELSKCWNRVDPCCLGNHYTGKATDFMDFYVLEMCASLYWTPLSKKNWTLIGELAIFFFFFWPPSWSLITSWHLTVWIWNWLSWSYYYFWQHILVSHRLFLWKNKYACVDVNDFLFPYWLFVYFMLFSGMSVSTS